MRNFKEITKKQIIDRMHRYRAGDLPLLGSPKANIKVSKAQKHGILTVSLSLAPSDECLEIQIEGLIARNMCPRASKACRQACIVNAGNYTFNRGKIARIAKTLFWLNYPEEFKALISMEIKRHIFLAQKQNMVPAIRTNTLSDDTQLALWIAKNHPEIQAYDYTKNLKYWLAEKNRQSKPSNYTVAYSLSESNKRDWDKLMAIPGSLGAVVFDAKKHSLPDAFEGFDVVDGDEHDALFLRTVPNQSMVVGLALKGASNAIKDIARVLKFAQAEHGEDSRGRISSSVLPV